MVDAPLFSILMPTHSRLDVIRYAIQSILNQSVSDFELLVVGDGCAPGTADVVHAFDDPRIRFFDLPKAPHFGYANRNIALRQSRGRFIAFMADDDLVLPDHLAILRDGLDSGSALAYTQAVWVSTDGVAAPFLTNLELQDELEIFMNQWNSIPASCFAYRADILPKRDAWPEDVASAADWRLWHAIIKAAPDNPLVYCRIPTVLHFSAKWKQSRNSLMPQLATFLDIADNAAWWPKSLKAQIPPETTEQTIYAALLENSSWTATFRRDATDLIGRIAWDDIGNLRPELNRNKIRSEQLMQSNAQIVSMDEAYTALQIELDMRLQDLEAKSAQLADLERKLQQHAIEIAQLRNSKSWKLTKPLRDIVSFIRR
ncbi:glycosyltransferase family 2 protein [Brucella haematophila]|uniref:Glycosyltransferase n=1 Tax=Brucella haematophila TaxID=419474 RepID=A0ABX1DIY6_9HYPH|nr:glycosyltransferase family 2 protein [Brucella haematophila]NKC02937.1 glycosyltransferase [Brucella haematophila]TMV01701.1 glycosyltransferase [Brucella haematophila]